MVKNILPEGVYNSLKRLSPWRVYRQYQIQNISNHLRKLRVKRENNIPKVAPKQKHIKNLKALTDRAELLKFLPKNGVVAEIGVAEGEFSEQIFKYSFPKKLYLIDSWNSEMYPAVLEQNVRNRLSDKIANGYVEIKKGNSLEMTNDFPDNYFDWVYIDSDHSYDTTIEELKLYSKKLKPDGIIAGHDFIIGNWVDSVRFGVIEAVYKFCIEYDWEILYQTMELQENPSFAIRRIDKHKE